MATQTIITDPQRISEEGTSFGTSSGIEMELSSETVDDLQIAEPLGGPYFPDSLSALLSLPVDHAAAWRSGPWWASTGVLPPSPECGRSVL